MLLTHAHKLLHLLLLHPRLELSLLGGRESVDKLVPTGDAIQLKSHEPIHVDCMRSDIETEAGDESNLCPYSIVVQGLRIQCNQSRYVGIWAVDVLDSTAEFRRHQI